MVTFTHHAIDRYRRRCGAPVPLDDVVNHGEFRDRCPAGVHDATGADGFLIHGQAVFVLRRDGADAWIALTCLRRLRRSKAERRAYREQRRLAEHPELEALAA